VLAVTLIYASWNQPVLTGAMTSLGFEGSDGLQNPTEALLAVRLVAAGIYVSMHGQLFPVGRVRKDHKFARFAWTKGPAVHLTR
jgi:L-asparaginase